MPDAPVATGTLATIELCYVDGAAHPFRTFLKLHGELRMPPMHTLTIQRAASAAEAIWMLADVPAHRQEDAPC